jgi:hypothetical protein
MKATFPFLAPLLLAILFTACASNLHQRKLVSHVISSVPSLSSHASTDSGAAASCCSGSGEAKCIGSSYCNACSTCEYCEYCNSGGSCGVCARSSAPASYGSSSSSGSGQISFWTDMVNGGSIKIYVDGEYVGELESYFSSGTPRCRQAGTVTISRSAGTHSYLAKDGNGNSWKGTISFPSSGCTTMELTN